MKSIVIAACLIFSFSASAKTLATEGVKNLIESGEYVGLDGAQSCIVTVLTKADSVTISIKTNESYDVFPVLDSGSRYFVNEETGAISANRSFNFPHYLQGGSQLLNVKKIQDNQIQFSISNILLDHRGNDSSTYSSCKVSL